MSALETLRAENEWLKDRLEALQEMLEREARQRIALEEMLKAGQEAERVNKE